MARDAIVALSDYLPGGSFSRDLASTVLGSYFPIHCQLEPIRDTENHIVDWRIVAANAATTDLLPPGDSGPLDARILDLVPIMRSMPLFDELREAFDANVPVVRRDVPVPWGATGQLVDLVAYRSATVMHLYAQDNGARLATATGADIRVALEAYFKGRLRFGSSARVRAFYEAIDRGAGGTMVMRVPSGRSEPIEVDVISPDAEITIVSRAAN